MDPAKKKKSAKRVVFFIGFGVEKDGHRGICGPEKRFLQTCQMAHLTEFLPIVIYPTCGRLFSNFKTLHEQHRIIMVTYTPKGRFSYIRIVYQTLKKYSPHAIHSQGPHLFDLIAAVLGRLMNTKVIVTRPVNVSQDHISHFKRFLFLTMDQIVARVSDHLVAISNTHKRQWIQELSALVTSSDLRKIQTIYNGIYLHPFSEPSPRPFPPPVIFTICAQLTPVKGHDLMLRVVHQLYSDGYQCYVNVLGDGPLKSDLERQCQALKISSMVQFHGHVACVDSVFKETHVVVLPSLREGLSLALLEAMAMGCPLIASNVGASSELIDNGYNGFLVKKNNAEELYLAMKFFLDYPSTIQSMGKRSLEKVQKFDFYKMFDSYCRLYLSP